MCVHTYIRFSIGATNLLDLQYAFFTLECIKIMLYIKITQYIKIMQDKIMKITSINF